MGIKIVLIAIQHLTDRQRQRRNICSVFTVYSLLKNKVLEHAVFYISLLNTIARLKICKNASHKGLRPILTIQTAGFYDLHVC